MTYSKGFDNNCMNRFSRSVPQQCCRVHGGRSKRRLFEMLVLALCLMMPLAACKTRTATGPSPLDDRSVRSDPAAEVTPEQIRAFEDAVAVLEEQQAEGEVDLDELQGRFEQLIRRAPQVGEAWYNLGVILERRGDLERAEQAYKRALEQKPTLKEAAENLAVLFHNQGNVGEAVDVLHQILTVQPDASNARARLADIYREQGDNQNARAFAREALIRDAENAVAYKVLMFLAMADGDAPRARLLARRVLSLGGEDPEVYWELAKLEKAAGDLDAAKSNLRRAASLREDYLAPRLLQAKIAMDEEDWSTARSLYKEVLQQEPEMADVWLNVGVASRALGEYEPAEKAYRRAISIDSDLAVAHFNLGVLRFRMQNDPAGALEDLQRFVSLSRALPRDHLAFALIHEAEETIRLEEEMRQMEEEMRRQEEEAARLAEEEARRAEEQARIDAQRAAEEESAGNGDEDEPSAPESDPETEPESAGEV